MFAPLDFARSSFLCFFLKKKGKNAPGCHPIRRRERGKSMTSPQRWTGGSWGMVLDGTMHSGACGNAACFDGHRSVLRRASQRTSTGIAARCIRHCSALRFPVQPSIGNPSALRTMPMGAVRIRFHMPVSTSRPFSQIPRDALKKTAAPLECPAGR